MSPLRMLCGGSFKSKESSGKEKGMRGVCLSLPLRCKAMVETVRLKRSKCILHRFLPIRPATQFLVRPTRRRDLDKSHPMHSCTPAKSPNVVNHLGRPMTILYVPTINSLYFLEQLTILF